MKPKLLTIAMMVALMLAAITRGQAQEYDGPCLPPMHGLLGDQSALCGSSQTLTLSSGTNWVSFNVETTLDDLKAALVDALSGTGAIAITIQGKSQNTKYTGGRWRGNLTFDVTQMYMIDVSAACEISLEGVPVNPSEHPITIVNGANWIAYPLEVSMTQEQAFAGFNVVNGDVISAKGGNARYTGGRWRGTVNLTPGQGYIYTSAASGNRTLIFPNN